MPRTRHGSLRAWRQAQRFTVDQAAAFCGVPRMTYYNAERGARPRTKSLRKILARTGLSLEALVLPVAS